ncbi:hypothetical protein QOT17_020094 [Balamuthia mandrillaris]
MAVCAACIVCIKTAKSLGRFSLSYGTGFLLGPAVGGTLSVRVGYHAVAALAAFESLWVFFLTLRYLPPLAGGSPFYKRTVGQNSYQPQMAHIGGTTMYTVTTSILTKSVKRSNTGTLLGAYHATRSGCNRFCNSSLFTNIHRACRDSLFRCSIGLSGALRSGSLVVLL